MSLLDRVRRHFSSQLGREVIAAIEEPSAEWRVSEDEGLIFDLGLRLCVSLDDGFVTVITADSGLRMRILHLRGFERKAIAQAARKRVARQRFSQSNMVTA